MTSSRDIKYPRNDLFFCTEAMTLKQAAMRCVELKTNSLAVIDQMGNVLGVVTALDLIREMLDAIELYQEPNLESFMTTQILSSEEADLTPKLLEEMDRHICPVLVVLKDGGFAQLFSKEDLYDFLSRG